ncbi:MAG: hypothetical protein COA90_04105 [Gammaproteobacteria bacterium]|nr:MAG: hypothetical protein COA90_04105 [Gammaproteobacteria bacterium]
MTPPPRPRKKGSKDLPANLYASKSGKDTYYAYKNPKTGDKTGMGKDRLEAINAAIQLNAQLMQEQDLISRVLGASNRFKDFLDTYRDEVIPARRVNGFPLSDVTIHEQGRVIGHIITELGHLDITKVTQKDIAEYLAMQSTAETYNKHRSLLITIFKQAISEGIIEANLPERILKRDLGQTLRSRLSLEQYKLIYQYASPVIQNAMELSLNALQRRADIQSWRFDCEKDDFFYIIQSKTRKHGKAAYLRIPVDLPVTHSEAKHKTLGDIVKACRDSNVCPFVIHQQPKKRRPSKEKEHSMQLSGKEISNGFTQARKKAGIEGDHPPTFHELLGLGEYLREQQGWSIKQLQTLRGHTSEKMTLKYLEGHSWTTVEMVK